MSRFRKKRISKITGKLFSVLSGLKNRTTQNEKEENVLMTYEMLYCTFYDINFMIKGETKMQKIPKAI